MSLILVILCITNFVSGFEVRHKDSRLGDLDIEKRDVVDDNPYKCNIYNETTHICACVILSQYEVVTLAQCVNDWEVQRLRVRNLASNRLVEFHDVAAVKIHPGYDHRKVGRRLNDIAVVRILEPIIGEEHYALLFEEDASSLVGSEGFVVGFNYDKNRYTWDMQTAPLVVENKTTCNYHILGGTAPGQFCGTLQFLGQNELQPKLCTEDKGTVFETVNHRVVGLASDWEGQCSEKLVLTDITYYRDFIKESQKYFKGRADNGDFQMPTGFEIKSNRIAQCNIFYGQDFLCSGIIVSRYEIIAPARCVRGWKTHQYDVRIQTPQKMIEYHEVLDVNIHPDFDYRGGKPINDIAVARVAGSLGKPRYWIESFGEGNALKNETMGTLIGTDPLEASPFSWAKMDYRAIVVDQSVCDAHAQSEIEAGQFCASIIDPRDQNKTTNKLDAQQIQYWTRTKPQDKLCPGDNGTSFYVDNELVGMASYWVRFDRYRCSKSVVYTKIASYRDFINQSLKHFKQKADRGEFKNPPGSGNPIVSIEGKGGKFICAGVLISDRDIITSATCSRQTEPNRDDLTMIRAGTEFPTKGGQLKKEIRRCYIKDRRTDSGNNGKNYDIVVMRVAEAFELSGDVSMIDLYKKDEKLWLSEPGQLSFYSDGSSLIDEQVYMKDVDTCKQEYSTSTKGSIADDQFCAGPTKSCENDHGGLFVVNKKLAGFVTHREDSCGPQRKPDVFTEIAKVRDEIDACLAWFKELKGRGDLDQYNVDKLWIPFWGW